MLQFLALTAIALSPHAHGPHTQPVAAPIIEAPNIVTPLLPHGYKRAQEKSKVSLPGYNATELYSGFFTIDESTNSNTYFLFSTAQSKRKDAPVILWLNGGPGASSLLGFFDELGPFGIDENMKMVPREVSWNRDAHLLALDNPLGVGYSFTDSRSRMATNQTTVGADLYGALDQFFQLFPDLRSNAFYATGESYAGKYIPAVAYTIHQRNSHASPERQINLRGVGIGDGAFDPPTQFTGFGPLLFNIGLADTRMAKVYEQYDARFMSRLAAGDRVGAFRSFDEMLNGDYYGPSRTYYGNTTGMGSNYFNYALEPGAASLTRRTFPAWLATARVASALHVGSVAYAVFNRTVEDRLIGDWVVGVVPMLEVLLEHYDVLIYSGQYDVILGPPGTERAIEKLKWSGAEAYAAAPTERFVTAGADGAKDLAGYVRQVVQQQRNAAATRTRHARSTTFSYVMLRGCGHMVPSDQPHRAHEMIRRFLVPFAPLPQRGADE